MISRATTRGPNQWVKVNSQSKQFSYFQSEQLIPEILRRRFKNILTVCRYIININLTLNGIRAIFALSLLLIAAVEISFIIILA